MSPHDRIAARLWWHDWWFAWRAIGYAYQTERVLLATLVVPDSPIARRRATGAVSV